MCRVTRALRGQGSHRELHTVVECDQKLPSSGGLSLCWAGIVDTLPNTVFVDPYELREARRKDPSRRFDIAEGTVHTTAGRRRGAARPLTDKEVDLEVAASHPRAIPLRVNAWIETSNDAPMPLRWTFSLPLHARYQDATPAQPYREAGLPPMPEKLTVICSDSSVMDWTHKMVQQSSNVAWDVPVGDLTQEPVVTFVTTLVTFVSALFLMWSMLRH